MQQIYGIQQELALWMPGTIFMLKEEITHVKGKIKDPKNWVLGFII
jgi:hypothetical protein